MLMDFDAERPKWVNWLAPLVLLAGAILFLQIIGSLIGWLFTLSVVAAIGYGANRLSPVKVPYGWLGNIAVGMLGAVVGGWLFGSFGPQVGDIAVVPALLGACILTYGLHIKRQMERNKILEQMQAKAQGDPYLGTRLGNVWLAERIGEGATATVYRAVPDDTLSDSDSVAVKVLKESTTEDELFMKRLQREFNLCKTIDHPNIIKTFEMGEQGGLYYLVLEYLEGPTLREVLDSGKRMSVREVLEQSIPLLEGLYHAHEIGVLHRDFKPENIMVTKDGLKLMDFGLARGAGDSNVTKTGTALGTPAYMSPEQIKGETSKRLDPRSDQYAAGVVIYEMLAGRTPFQDKDAMGVMFKHISESAPPLREFRPEVSEHLEAVVMRMLEKEADDRFDDLRQVAQELRKELKKLQEEERNVVSASHHASD